MLGAAKVCPNCSSKKFKRTPRSRATQCSVCHMIVEERARSYLPEYHVVACSEELHCAVTPDLRGDANTPSSTQDPDDPVATAGFISAFRLLSPLRQPVYGATANTLSGSLAEMERVLGDTLEENRGAGGEKRGDPGLAATGYFEIVDLADLLDVDSETVILASQMFVRTSNIVSTRGRQVEALSAACLLLALEFRHTAHGEWVANNPDDSESRGTGTGESKTAARMEKGDVAGGENGSDELAFVPASIVPSPQALSIDVVASTASVSVVELKKDLRLVRSVHMGDALLRQSCDDGSILPSMNASSARTEAPSLCTDGLSRACAASFERVPEYASSLGLDEDGVALAVSIVDKSFRLNVCPRRAPASVAAAGIYLATQISGLRLTQTEVCLVLKVTEVTLRKVYRELCESVSHVVPDGASLDKGIQPQKGRQRKRGPIGAKKGDVNAAQRFPGKFDCPVTGSAGESEAQGPKGIGAVATDDDSGDEGLVSPLSLSPDKCAGAASSSENRNEVASKDHQAPGSGTGEVSHDSKEGPWSASPQNSSALATMNEQQRQMMVAMVQNPAVAQAFASAMATAGLMPTMVPPPPPPPLPVQESIESEAAPNSDARKYDTAIGRNESGAVPGPDIVKAALAEAFARQNVTSKGDLGGPCSPAKETSKPSGSRKALGDI